jgi:sortase A
VLIAVGVILLGYVGWEYAGTNVVSHHRQQGVQRLLQQSWAHGHASVATAWGRTQAVIRIPRFGSHYRVPVLEGTGDGALAAGFGHYVGTAGPGGVGNYAVAAHRVTHGEPLHHMPELRAGDRVVVETAGATYTYRLTSGGDDLVVPDTATWVTETLPRNPTKGGVQPAQQSGQRLLTLTTCAELFHTDDRMVAFGVLVDSVEGSGAPRSRRAVTSAAAAR